MSKENADKGNAARLRKYILWKRRQGLSINRMSVLGQGLLSLNGLSRNNTFEARKQAFTYESECTINAEIIHSNRSNHADNPQRSPLLLDKAQSMGRVR